MSSSIAVKAIAAQGALATAAGVALWRSRESHPPQSADAPLSKELVLSAAASIVKAAHSYGFVCTPTPNAAPDCRIMDLHFLSDKTFEFGLVSRTTTRKADSLKQSPHCTIAFQDPRASNENGYLSLSGTARRLDSNADRSKVWKSSWSLFHPTGGPSAEEVVVWHFKPQRLEAISHNHAVSDWWQPVTMTRDESAGAAAWELQPRRREARREAAAAAQAVAKRSGR